MKKETFYKKNKYSRGIALVFAIMLSVILFTFAAGVLSIATKELNFTTSGKDSNDAFYAADSGIECALFNEKNGNFNKGSVVTEINCFEEKISLEGKYPIFNFTLLNLGSSGQACTNILVNKEAGSSPEPENQIISKGYNLGGNDKFKCKQLEFGLESTERVIEVLYENE